MRDVLFWVIPPVVGAVIGYVTNAVAIKMLFRPLNEIRLLGRRLPFTPGILPRERHKLADSIGRMVEQELLTSEVLRERLAKTEVREKIKGTLCAYTDQMLAKPLSFYVEKKAETSFPGDDLPLAELVSDFVNSNVFDSFLEEIIKNWALGPETSSTRDSVYETIETTIGNEVSVWLKSRFRDIGGMLVPTARDLIKSGLVKEIRNHARGEPSFYRRALEGVIERYPGISLGEFISLGSVKKKTVDSFLAEKAADTLDENVEGALSSVNVKVLVSERIDSLDMLRVEKIVLDVMAGQLKWINVFGAILGALIGFVQVILSLFTG
ncbi:MAG: DUF445 family protein [Treponema sp.]|jgi:uncharacterized membrane protein YheB (UPF0754 family)|nr:DUF445 family protein [Treponema sp.]